MSSNINKTKSPTKKNVPTTKSGQGLAELFGFFARIAKLKILNSDDTDG